jgi:hypothetical protein
MEDKIKEIRQRILDEQRKHPDLDWAQLAAIKIYKTYFESQVVSEEEMEKEALDFATSLKYDQNSGNAYCAGKRFGASVGYLAGFKKALSLSQL